MTDTRENIIGEIIAINVSERRGTVKTSVDEGTLVEGFGLEGDAHGGDWDRQISLFSTEALEKVPDDLKEEVFNGGYTENLTIQGIPLTDLFIGTKLRVGDALVEILQIGKEKYEEHGRPYIVSREGRFGRVIKGGKVRVGDKVRVL